MILNCMQISEANVRIHVIRYTWYKEGKHHGIALVIGQGFGDT